MEIAFTDLQSGDCARVIGYQGLPESYQRKLQSLGLTRGATLKVLRSAPLGDPVQVTVRGFSVSLRRQEAAGLRLFKLG